MITAGRPFTSGVNLVTDSLPLTPTAIAFGAILVILGVAAVIRSIRKR